MTLLELVKDIVEQEHLGKLCEEPNIEIVLRPHGLRIYWNSLFEGKVSRQYAAFKSDHICWDVKEGE